MLDRVFVDFIFYHFSTWGFTMNCTIRMWECLSTASVGNHRCYCPCRQQLVASSLITRQTPWRTRCFNHTCISLILQDELQHDCHRSQVAQSINAIVCSWIVNSRHLVHKIQISFRFPVSTFLWVGILRWQKVRTPATNSTDQIDPTITMAQVLRAGQTQPETDWYSEEGPAGVVLSGLPWRMCGCKSYICFHQVPQLYPDHPLQVWYQVSSLWILMAHGI